MPLPPHLKSELHASSFYHLTHACSHVIRATLASQTIITMLPSSPQVLSVYAQGITPTLKRLPKDLSGQTLCIDSTTLDVSVARDVARDVVNAGARMVDAPVSGGSLKLHRLHSQALTPNIFRCNWCQSWYSVIPCRRSRGVFWAFKTYPRSYGPTYHTLRGVWCRARSEDL